MSRAGLEIKKVQPATAWASVLQIAVTEVFEMMVGTRVLPLEQSEVPVSSEVTAMVGLAGKLCGALSLRCSAHTAVQIAGRMMPDALPDNGNPSQVFDAMGEICNMVAGNFKAKIACLAEGCLLSVPTVISGGDYRTHTLVDSETVEIQVRFEGSPISVALDVQS